MYIYGILNVRQTSPLSKTMIHPLLFYTSNFFYPTKNVAFPHDWCTVKVGLFYRLARLRDQCKKTKKISTILYGCIMSVEPR